MEILAIHEQADTELACDHPESEIRYKLDTYNRRLYVRQCLSCGRQLSGAIKHSEIQNPRAVKPFDQELEDGWWRLRRIRANQIAAERREAALADRREEYDRYLQSNEWREKSLAVLQRDGIKCTARLPGCLGRASQAHHLTYARVYDEPLFDLMAVCTRCHQHLHQNGDE
jgi:5-methylcytosine-specific restriction endonuclease McrA